MTRPALPRSVRRECWGPSRGRDTDETNLRDRKTAAIRAVVKWEMPAWAIQPCRFEFRVSVMFQIVGSLLALATVVATLAFAPVYGLVLAFATLGWVAKATPAQVSAVAYNNQQGGVVVFPGQFRA